MPQKKSGLPPSRAAALAVLTRCLDGGQDLQAALDEELTKRRLTHRDAALATELAYGYLRRDIQIDFLLNRFLKDPGGIKPKVRRTLGVAAYEIVFLDRVPAYASVDWAVSQTRRLAGEGLAKVANAVLRRVSDLDENAREPQMYRGAMTSLSRHLSHFYSCPEWMVALWLDAYGEDKTRAYLAAQVQAPPVGLRVNRSRPEAKALHDELLTDEHVLALSTGLAVAPGGHNLGEAMDAGLISRQSAAAQQVMLELGCLDWPEPVWDACSGRGGKSCLLAENGKAVIASDVHPGRLAGLKEDAKRLGLAIPVFTASADQPAPMREAPGTVLLDAPCSGFGVISRRPDIKHKRRPEHLQDLVELQGRMLESAAKSVRPGGLVAYITCTLNPAENEGQIENLLAREPGLTLEKTWTTPLDSPLNEFFYGALLRKA